MKKLFTLLCGIGLMSAAFAQTWDFTTSPSFPAGFVTWKLDGQTANSGFSTATQNAFNNGGGWVILGSASTGYLAATTSWFNNLTVPCDRWLVTPQITVPTGMPNYSLVWYGESLDASYPDSYEVRVSTTDSATTSFGPAQLTIEEPGNLTVHVLPLAAYAGQTIRVAFRDVSTNEYILAFTKMQVTDLPSYDLSVKKVETYEHNWLSQSATLSGTIQNLGFDTVHSFQLNYSVNGGAAVSTTVNVDLPALSIGSYSIPGYTAPAEGVYSFKVWADQINGSIADQVPANDSASTSGIFFYPQVAGLQKNVLVEEFTGAWCGYCPGGAFAMRDLLAAMPNAIAVSIHDQAGRGATSDLMQIADGVTVSNTFNTGFPSAMVDRVYYIDQQDVALGFYGYTNTNYNNLQLTEAQFRATQATPVNVSLSGKTYDSTTNQLSVTVNADFLNGLSQGDYRFNLMVVEDSVITSGTGYDQENYYADPQGYMSGQSDLNTLPATITNNGQVGGWSQNHVLRAMAGTAWGTGSVIPSAPAAGSSYSKTYTLTLNPSWRNHFIKLVGVVQEYNTSTQRRYILNAAETTLLDVNTSIRETAQLNKLGIYPNPASTMAKLDIDLKKNETVEISVVNSLGQTVSEPNSVLLNAGAHTVNIPVAHLANGLYTVKVTVDGNVSSLPLSIQK
ncbi:MAG: choice-of-anchor J domain-containing protein [Bacteroidetes bacterium]|nr:choice-of-anchor J domain-containing protein [Bacteroidota bacterium]